MSLTVRRSTPFLKQRKPKPYATACMSHHLIIVIKLQLRLSMYFTFLRNSVFKTTCALIGKFQKRSRPHPQTKSIFGPLHPLGQFNAKIFPSPLDICMIFKPEMSSSSPQTSAILKITGKLGNLSCDQNKESELSMKLHVEMTRSSCETNGCEVLQIPRSYFIFLNICK